MVATKVTKVDLLVSLVLSLVILPCFGQAQSRWRTYSPPDKSFTVQVPVTPHEADQSSAGTEEPAANGWKPLYSHMVVASIMKPRMYAISVYEVVSPFRDETDKRIDELIREMTDIGSRLTSSKQIAMPGGRGREFTMVRKDGEENVFARSRVIEVDGRAYILMYMTDTANDLTSRSASRFFTSFKVRLHR